MFIKYKSKIKKFYIFVRDIKQVMKLLKEDIN